MAQKKGLIYDMTMGRENNHDFREARLPGTCWQIFKDLFSNKFSLLLKVNLLMMVFILPALVWVYYSSMLGSIQSSAIPYSGNVGFGYPAVNDAITVGKYARMAIDIRMYIVLIPLFVFAAIGLAGGFYIMKHLVWGEKVPLFKTFFKGIKNSAIIFAITFLFLALGVALVGILFSYNTVWESGLGGRVAGLIFAILLLVILLFMACYICSQAVTYKFKLWAIIKNSFLFSVGMLFNNIIFILACTAGPLILLMIVSTQLQTFFMMFYILIGTSLTVLVWTLIGQNAFDRFINVRAGAQKDSTLYKMTSEQKSQTRKEAEDRRKKNVKIVHQNSKKKKKDPPKNK